MTFTLNFMLSQNQTGGNVVRSPSPQTSKPDLSRARGKAIDQQAKVAYSTRPTMNYQDILVCLAHTADRNREPLE
jgi:hypothetical protein